MSQTESIGKRIQNLLEMRNMTQRELANKVGMTEVTIGRYVKDSREPKATVLSEIAIALDSTTDYLLNTTDNPDRTQSQTTAEGDEDEISEEEIYTIAAHRVGHEGPLTGEEMERIKMALKIALAKNGK